jgi:hypothetical protein
MDASVLSDIAETPSAAASSQRRPAYLRPIWLLTGIYLTFELAFNARLLDVAGGRATPDEVDAIEHWGRFISGTALALGIWGVVVMPRGVHQRWSVARWAGVLAVSAAISIAAVYNFERALIDHLVDRSDGTARRIAAQTTLLAHAILTQDVQVDGIDLSPEQLAKPEGKTFIALLPAMAFSTNDLSRKAENALRQVIHNGVVESMGSPEAFYNKSYVPSVRTMRDAFNKYAAGVNEMGKALDGIPATQADAWQRYVEDLRKKGYRPETVPPFGYGRVREGVRKQGVPIPADWRPSDRATFDRAVRDKVETEAHRKYRTSIEQQFGGGAQLPDDLPWDAFVQQPLVQAKWQKALDLPASVRMTPTLSVEDYSRLAYRPRLDREVEARVTKYEAAAGEFDSGGRNEKLGQDAMRALLVPPIALGFSLMGALVHLFKFSLYSARFVSARRRLNMVVIGSSVAAVALSAFLAPNAITTSRVYGYFETHTASALGTVPAHALTWVVQAQPFAYPVNEAVRASVLHGLTFGYEPAGERQ